MKESGMKEELVMVDGKDDGDERFVKWRKRRISERNGAKER
jgi:hypothetical protein